MKFKKGVSGNPNGRPKVDQDFKESCRRASVDALKRLMEIAADQSNENSFRANIWICEQAFGKAGQAVRYGSDNYEPIVITIKDS